MAHASVLPSRPLSTRKDDGQTLAILSGIKFKEKADRAPRAKSMAKQDATLKGWRYSRPEEGGLADTIVGCHFYEHA
jgi:hypothetical protein